MWLSKLNDMSVGPLWVLRTPPSGGSAAADEVCAQCQQNWLLSDSDSAVALVVLDTVITDLTQQTLLHNCLAAAGWQDACAVICLHGACPDSAAAALQALQKRLAQMPDAVIIVFGESAGRRIDLQFQRGRLHRYRDRRLVVTHHPQQMLDHPALKAEVWSDLCLARYGS